MIIDSRIYCELAAWTDDGGVFASVSLVSCERVDQAEEPEYVDFVNLEKDGGKKRLSASHLLFLALAPITATERLLPLLRKDQLTLVIK